MKIHSSTACALIGCAFFIISLFLSLGDSDEAHFICYGGSAIFIIASVAIYFRAKRRNANPSRTGVVIVVATILIFILLCLLPAFG
jgi:hypothetical protein